MINRLLPPGQGVHLGVLVPVAFTVVLIMLNAVITDVLGMTSIAPNVTLMCVMYWAVHRPELLPAWAVMLLGLLNDTFTGGLLGLNAAFLVIAHRLLTMQSHIFRGKDFIMTHLGFSLLLVLTALLSWGIVSLIYGVLLPVLPLIIHTLLTVALFPWLFVMMNSISLYFLPPSDGF